MARRPKKTIDAAGERGRPLPTDSLGWLSEICDAYADAAEALPFTALMGERADQEELFHLAPHVAIKFRGLPERRRRSAVEAALTTIVASEEWVTNRRNPLAVFALGYLAAHFGLDILTANQVDEIMLTIEESCPVGTERRRTKAPRCRRR